MVAPAKVRAQAITDTGAHVGILTASPTEALDVRGNIRLGNQPGGGEKLFLSSDPRHFIRSFNWWTEFHSHPNEGWKYFSNDGATVTEVMRLSAGFGGSLKIRSSAPDDSLYALRIGAPQEIIVDDADGYIRFHDPFDRHFAAGIDRSDLTFKINLGHIPGAETDFVMDALGRVGLGAFAEDYRLPPLSEVEAHIERAGHLPGIPSVREIAEQGVSVGGMQARLLAKIEELTLHLIRQEKLLVEQAAVLERVRDDNAELRSRLEFQ
ncbi:MAG: hypothetical protein ACREIA_19555 [Opitutaceae bacterium]